MVEMNTQGDVFSTATVPKQDSAAHQAVVMPTHSHVLEESNMELDRIFWEKVNATDAASKQEEEEEEEKKGAEDEISAEWREIKTWLSTFDTQMKGAIVLMCRGAADETRPFQEKYEAREVLETMAKEIKAEWLEQSDVVKIVKALLYNRIG